MDVAAIAIMMLLTGSEWGLPGGGEAPSLQFHDGRVSGSGGCNRFGGSYSQDGASVKISHVISTQMACADHIMRKDRAWLAMLEAVRSVDASHTVLTLKDGSGSVLVTLARRDWD
jgi:heat shock protein HslJ